MFLFKPCFIVRPLSTIETTLVGWRWGGGCGGASLVGKLGSSTNHVGLEPVSLACC